MKPGHYEDCWREHPACAEEKILQLKWAVHDLERRVDQLRQELDKLHWRNWELVVRNANLDLEVLRQRSWIGSWITDWEGGPWL